MAKRPVCFDNLVVVTLAVLMLITVNYQYRYDLSLTEKEFRSQMHHEANVLAQTFNHKMMMYYQGLKIISRIPAVRNMDHHAENLNEEDLWILNELYSNLNANIDGSEVYVVPLDFDHSKIDVHTGKPFEPAIVLDHYIAEEEIEGEESYEYHQLFQQLQWVKKHVPTEKNYKAMGSPAITGEEIITCDDRYYELDDFSDKDRSGIIYSVPFYGAEGKLKGLVAGIILTRVLRGILSNENFVIRNNATGYSIKLSQTGVLHNSDQWIRKGERDPELIYSEALPLKINDKVGDWVVWAGVQNEEFWDLPAVKAQREFAYAAYVIVILVAIVVITNIRKQKLIAEKNIELGYEVEDRKEAQRSLEQHGARLGAIFTSVMDGIITSDENGVIEKCNPALESLFGYEKGELIGKKINVLMTKSDRVHHDKYLSRYIESQESKVIGMQNRRLLGLRKDGSMFPVEITVSSTESGGRKFFVGVMRDLTERDMVEHELAGARDAALESSRLKSELLANVSHELRTPMNGIMGCSELLKDTKLDDEQSGYLKILSDSSNGLLTIMDDLIDLSRLDVGKLVLAAKEFGIRESVDSAIQLVTDRASEKGLELKVEYADDLPEVVCGDANRLSQVLTNLIGNAIKFTEQGGITVTVSTVDSDNTNQMVRFEVSDTGIGISEENHSKIFNSFVQGDGSITREFGGMGLGLAICNRLVNAMKGEIGLNSTEGDGSTFWFQVPFEIVSSGNNSSDNNEEDVLRKGEEIQAMSRKG